MELIRVIKNKDGSTMIVIGKNEEPVELTIKTEGVIILDMTVDDEGFQHAN